MTQTQAKGTSRLWGGTHKNQYCVIIKTPHYHENHNCGHDYQLLLAAKMLLFETILSNVEQKLMFGHHQTCYARSTEGTVHGIIWKNQQSPSVFLHDANYHNYM